ncbi:MAG TPA: polysaccharide biosynthesis/export family protein [Polyangiaceae bacterium]
MYRAFWLVLALSVMFACTGTPPSPRNLPAPILSTSVGPGDVFEISVVGEKDLPKEYKINADGTLDFPYLQRVAVTGLEPQQVGDLLKQKLVEAKILTDPQINILVKTYASKKVSVIGQVNKPGSVAWTDGIKLVDVIVQSGGFTSIADSKHVILTRQTAKDKSITVAISVDAITDGDQPDIPLQAGDTIKIEARVF